MQKKIIFYFKADEGIKFGFGHAYRVLNIYKKLKLSSKNTKFFFIINKNTFLLNFLKSKKISNIHFIEEIYDPKLFDIFQNSKIIIDIYRKTDRHINFIKSKFKDLKTIALDNFEIKKNFDAYINGVSYAQKKIYNRKKNIYQGFKYICIPNKNLKKKVDFNFKKPKIFVSTGGSDKKNIIIKITKYLLKLKNVKINILIGPGFEKHNKIFALNKKFEQIKLIQNVKNLSKYISKNDCAITTGGFVMYECLALNLPTFVIKNYEHQKYSINYLNKKKSIIYIGEGFSLNLKKFNKKINLINNYFFIKKIKQKILPLIDGNGLDRIIHIIKKI
jgi:spore coat polysaccharide biosynthesis predicted glycosyltransferase SpsG